MSSGLDEPKVIVESVVPEGIAFYDPSNGEIHIPDKDLLYDFVLEHEKQHFRQHHSKVVFLMDRRFFYFSAAMAVLNVVVNEVRPQLLGGFGPLLLVPAFVLLGSGGIFQWDANRKAAKVLASRKAEAGISR